MRRYFALLLLLAPRMSVASCIDYSNSIHWLGGRDTFGPAQGIATSGAFAYVADGTSGLQIINKSSPTFPTIVGSIDTPSMATDVVVSGSLCYVADRNGGLQVINTANPGTPVLMGSANTPGEAYGVAVSGTFAYVADWNSIQVIDVSNPASPHIVKTVAASGSAYDLVVSGNVLYVAANTHLQVIDISNPASAFTVGSLTLPSSFATSIAVSGSLAYLATYSGMAIVNVSNPNAPTLVSFFETPYVQPLGIAVSGNIAYVIGGKPGDLRLVDVSNPSSPVFAGSVGINPGYVDTGQSGRGAAVAVTGSVAYVAAGTLGLQIFDGATQGPALIGHTDTPDTACDVAIFDNFAYVADGQSGLQVIDIADPGAPIIVGSVDTPGYAVRLAVAGTFACVADQDAGLQVIDVSTPGSPNIVGNVAIPGGVLDVALAGPFAYVTGDGGMAVIDVSNPAFPVVLGTTDTPEWGGRAIAVQGSFAYIPDGAYAAFPGGNSRLWIINVENPTSPIAVGSVTVGSANELAVFGTRAYVTQGGGMAVIDVSNPESPGFLGVVQVQPSAALQGIALDGQFLYAAGGTTGVQVMTVLGPVRVGSGDTFGYAKGVAVSGAYMFVADGELGLEVLPRQCPTMTAVWPDEPKSRPATLGLAVPNPVSLESTTIPFTMHHSGPAKLRIIDTSGREVRVLIDQTLTSGEQLTQWDGRNKTGELLPDGVYFYQLVIPGYQATRKLVRVR